MTQAEPEEALSDQQLVELPFDEVVARLQRIVQALEAGDVGLEQSIALYREGLRLHAASEERLKAAELTITELGRRGAGSIAEEAGGPPETDDPGF
jgi:exodeoxyribonuclease VII small subunit